MKIYIKDIDYRLYYRAIKEEEYNLLSNMSTKEFLAHIFFKVQNDINSFKTDPVIDFLNKTLKKLDTKEYKNKYSPHTQRMKKIIRKKI